MATILIVDDRVSNRELLVTLLGYAGHRPLEAADGETGLAIARSERPDLIITDIVMPSMDGYEFARQVRADPSISQTQIIFYTSSYIVAETRRLAQACGVSMVLGKPIEPQQFLEKVAEALASPAVPISPAASEEFHQEHMRVLTDTLATKVDELEAEIAERKLAQDEVLESERRYYRVLDAMMEGCQIIDFDWRYVYVNDVVAAQAKNKKEDLLNRTMMDVYPGIENTEMFALLRQCMEQRTPRQMENQFVFPDGAIGWFELSIQPAREGIFILSTDITEKKFAQERVDYQARLLRRINDAVIATDNEFRITAWNRGAEKMYGWFEKEVIGHNVSEILRSTLTDEQQVEVREHHWKSSTSRGERVYRRKNGQPISVDENTIALTDENKKMTGYVSVHRDITERKLAEENLRKSQDRFTTLFHSSPVATSLSTMKEGRYLEVNDAFLKMFQRSRDEVIGHTVFELNVWVDMEQRAALFSKMNQDGKVDNFEMALYTRSGEIINLLWSGSQIVIGDEICLLGSALDITERKQAEEKLRQSDQILQRVKALVLVANLQGMIEYASPSAKIILGYEPEDLLGEGWWKVSRLEPLQVEHEKEYLRKAARGEIPIAADPYERVIQDTEGNTHWISWVDAAGPNNTLIGVGHDITERKQAEEAVLESARQMRALVTSLDDIVFEFDEEGIYLNVWAADESLLARPKVQLLGRRIEEILGEENGRPFAEAVKRVVESGHPESIEYSLEILGGQRWFLARISPIFTQNNSHRTASMLIRDITPRKQAEVALQQTRDFAENVIQTANVIFLQLDVAGNVRKLNTAGEEISGYSLAEVEGKSWFETLVPRDRYPYVWEEFTRVAQRGETPKIFENPILTKQGKERHILWKNNVLYEEDRIVGTISFGVDITERKQAEEALLKAHDRTEAILANVSDTYILFDSQWHYLYVNDAAARSIGKPREQILGHTLWELYPDIIGTELDRQYHRAMDEQLRVNFEFHYFTTDTWWDNRFYPIPDGLAVFATNITERKRAEAALRESEERFRHAIEDAPYPVMIHAEDGEIISVNIMWLSLTGYDRQEIQTMDAWTDRAYGERKAIAEAAINRLFALENVFDEGEDVVRTASGENRTWHFSSAPLGRLPDGRRIVISMANDVTERKQAETKIQQQIERLTALSEIDRAITSTTDMRLSLNILLSHTLSMFGVEAADVLLVNPILNLLDFAAGTGFKTKLIEDTQIRLGDEFAGRVALTRESRYVNDLKNQTLHPSFKHMIKEEGFISYRAVPLIAKGRVVGVLELFQRKTVKRDPEWLNFLEVVADQAAIAIDNTQAFEGMQRSNIELAMAYDATIEGWSHAMDLRDKETEGHTKRVTELTMRLAQSAGMNKADLVHVRRGALLHDMGKLGVPDSILLKPGKLTDEEWEIMRLHPTYARDMLASIVYLRPAMDIPYCHHEKWDGSGYPRGLKGDQIPLAARIFSIVDVWDALTSDRPYRAAWTRENTLAHIREGSGTHFDPQIVEVFLRLMDELS